MSSITLKDIAKALNLSASTVSRSLKDSHEINIVTKQKVLAYAQAHNFTLNAIAQSLKENKTRSISVIVPEIANHFFSDVINGIEWEAAHRKYQVVIFQTHESYEKEVANLSSGLARRTDGIIISLSGTTTHLDHFNKIKEDNVPIVFFDRVPMTENVHKVVVDNFEGAYQATKYLIDKGAKKIIHLTSPQNLSITQERLEGYKSCMAQHKLPVKNEWIKYCGFDASETNLIIESILKKLKPDGIFVTNDRLALNSLAAIKQHKKLLPKNFEIVGFTNMKYTDLLTPHIRIVRQPAYEMGKESARLLIDTIESKAPDVLYKKIVLKTELI